MKDQNDAKLNKKADGLELSAYSVGGSAELARYEENGTSPEIYVNEIYLNISKRLKVIRFILLFVIVILLLFAIMRFSSHINLYSIKEFFYSFKESEISLESASVSISGADLIDADSYRNYLLMLRNDRVELYKADGTRYLTKRIQMSNPAVKCSDKYFLLYDLGGYDISIYNTVDVIYEQKFDNTIYIADINDKGYLAVLTHDVSYASQLLVFNEDMNKVFEWNSADKYTSCMQLLEDGQRVVTASFSSSEGTPTTIFNLFTIKSETAVSHEFSGTLPLKIGEINGGIYLLCSDRIVFFNADGNIKKEIDVVSYGNTISEAYCDGKTLAVVFEEQSYSYGSKLVLFDQVGDELFTHDEKYEISSVAVINGELYYIHYGELVVVNIKENTKQRTSLTDSYSDLLEISGNLALISETETLIFSRGD